ncbi:aspartate kinase [bacterium]|nr:aspartate kinase [candidate division CSSED10-310 bacterium]
MIHKGLVVQKYGGCTLNTPERLTEALALIQDRLARNCKVVAVVSAMGRMGEPYATDSLLDLVGGAPHALCDRERALLMCCGELIAAVRFSHFLTSHQLAATALSGWEAGIRTMGGHCDATIDQVDPEPVLAALSTNDVVVVAGFQGMSSRGEITCLGRGGSDTSAVAVAVALHADRLEIIKDIPGIFSADPAVIPGAVRLHEIAAEDLREMAWQGAKVLHPRAAELVVDNKLEVLVRTTADARGTRIAPRACLEHTRFITGVALDIPVCLVEVDLDPVRPQEEMTELFEAVAGAGISMDMFGILKTVLRFTVKNNVDRVNHLLQDRDARFRLNAAMAKVSIVGAGMHGLPGVMARVCRTLTEAAVSIHQTSDSHATISVLVDAGAARLAADVLHAEFIEKT